MMAAAPAAASGADPGRWRETGISRIPFEYYQGVASDPDRRLWFDGVFAGLYRTDDRLRERARDDAAIPPLVTARELLHFMPVTHRRILRPAVRPRELVAGRPTRVTFIATTLRNGARRCRHAARRRGDAGGVRDESRDRAGATMLTRSRRAASSRGCARSSRVRGVRLSSRRVCRARTCCMSRRVATSSVSPSGTHESRVSATGPLRSRRGVAKLIVDSPRILARDDCAAHLAAEAEPPR
jgi:hypothetical protein